MILINKTIPVGILQGVIGLALFVIITTAQAAETINSEDKSEELDNIIVVASKRLQNMQEVPISMQAFGDEALQAARIVNIDDLAQKVPNVYYTDATSAKRSTPQVRGVVNGAGTNRPGVDEAMAFYVDEIYIATPAVRSLDLFDVERVELLRGPQGSLFGRNTIGGAINITTKPPEHDFGGYFEVTLGDYDLQRYRGSVSGPLSDSVRGKLSGVYHDRSGTTENIGTGNDLNNQHHWAAAASLDWDISDEATLRLSAIHKEVNQNSLAMDMAHYTDFGLPQPGGLGFNFLGVPYDTDPWDRKVNFDEDGSETLNYDLLAAIFNIEFEGYSFKSISSYQNHDYELTFDLDYTIAPSSYQEAPEQVESYQQEFRLTSDNSSSLRWILGAMYYYQKTNAVFNTYLDSASLQQSFSVLGSITGSPTFSYLGTVDYGATTAFGNTTLDSYALYGSLDYDLMDDVILTLGFRFTDETKDIDYEQVSLSLGNQLIGMPALEREQASDSWTAFTPTLKLAWYPTDDLMIYGTRSEGFKSGGFNDGFGAEPSQSFDQENMLNYELGMKGNLFKNRFQYGISAFQMDWENVQAAEIINQAAGGSQISLVVLDTQGDVEISGAELQLRGLITDNFKIDMAVGFLDSKWVSVREGSPLSVGDELSNSPPKQATLGLQYDLELSDLGSLVFRTDANFRGETPGGGSTAVALELQPSFTLYNASMTYFIGDGSWSVGVWGKNLSDEVYVVAIRDAEETSIINGARKHILGNPRTYGIDFRYHF